MTDNTDDLGFVEHTSNLFDPNPHLGSYVLLIEPTAEGTEPNRYFDTNQPESERNSRTRATVTADITVFPTPQHLAEDKGTFFVSQKLVHPYLVEKVQGMVGRRTAKRLIKRGRAFNFNWIESQEMDLVKAYVARRNAKLAAVANDAALGL